MQPRRRLQGLQGLGDEEHPHPQVFHNLGQRGLVLLAALLPVQAQAGDLAHVLQQLAHLRGADLLLMDAAQAQPEQKAMAPATQRLGAIRQRGVVVRQHQFQVHLPGVQGGVQGIGHAVEFPAALLHGGVAGIDAILEDLAQPLGLIHPPGGTQQAAEQPLGLGGIQLGAGPGQAGFQAFVVVGGRGHAGIKIRRNSPLIMTHSPGN